MANGIHNGLRIPGWAITAIVLVVAVLTAGFSVGPLLERHAAVGPRPERPHVSDRAGAGYPPLAELYCSKE